MVAQQVCRRAFRSEKGIIQGIDDNAGDGDRLNKPDCTAFTVIVKGITETVYRRRVTIVKLQEGVDPVNALNPDFLSASGFLLYFFPEACQKPPGIYPIARMGELQTTGIQIHLNCKNRCVF